jgi:hypothetical protein
MGEDGGGSVTINLHTQWEIIGSAQLDGTEVDLCVVTKGLKGKIDAKRVVEAKWEPDAADDVTWDGGRWVHWWHTEWCPVESSNARATHWMPVPQPPNA